MADAGERVKQIKTELINAAVAAVLQASGGMIANPINYSDRALIVEAAHEIAAQILSTEATGES